MATKVNKNPEETEVDGSLTIEELAKMPLAPKMSLSDLLSQAKDIPKDKQVQVSAEVFVPGLPNLEGTLGLKCLVKKPSVEDQIIILSKSTSAPDEVDEEYGTPTFTSPESRSQYWRCVWQLVTCVVQPSIDLPMACQLMGRGDGMDIVDPLLTAINKLSIGKPQKDDVRAFLSDYAAFPDLLEQLKVAHRAGRLVEFLSGDDSTVKTIKEMFRTISAVQKIVREEDAQTYGKITGQHTINELGKALAPEGKEEEKE